MSSTRSVRRRTIFPMFANGKDLAQVRAAMDFPKTLLHPSIREKVWGALVRGDLDEAVFAAFKAVEEAVRAAGSLVRPISGSR